MDVESAVEEDLEKRLFDLDATVASYDYNRTTQELAITVGCFKPVTNSRKLAINAVLNDFKSDWSGDVTRMKTKIQRSAPAPAPVRTFRHSWARKAYKFFELVSTAGTSRVVGPSRHA